MKTLSHIFSVLVLAAIFSSCGGASQGEPQCNLTFKLSDSTGEQKLEMKKAYFSASDFKWGDVGINFTNFDNEFMDEVRTLNDGEYRLTIHIFGTPGDLQPGEYKANTEFMPPKMTAAIYIRDKSCGDKPAKYYPDGAKGKVNIEEISEDWIKGSVDLTDGTGKTLKGSFEAKPH
jgi:hypothetical protein